MGLGDVYKRQAYDGSIDVDFIVLKKENETMYFGWDIIDLGEIKCSDSQYEKLVEITGKTFQIGEPKTLSIKSLVFIRLLSYPTRLHLKKEKLMEDFFYFENDV